MDPLERAVAKALAEKEAESHLGNTRAVTASKVERRKEPPSSVVSAAEPPTPRRSPDLTSLGSAPRVQLETVVQTILVQHHVDEVSLNQARIVGHLPGGKGANVYTMLRSQVMLKLRKHNCRSIAIIGPHVGAGKSSVASNLALSIARKKDQPVVLVDLDLRKPSLAKIFGIDPEYDIASYLDGSCSASQACIKTQFEGLHLCLGGKSHDNAAELLDSPKSKLLFDDLAKLLKNPIIIVDLPPIIGVSDVHTFLPNCDSALVVVEYAKTTKTDVEETLRLLGSTPLVGYVINKGHLDSDAAYGYGYGNAPEGKD